MTRSSRTAGRWLGLAAVLIAFVSLVGGPSADTSAASADDAARTVICPATRDVWLSAVEGEERFNMGASDRLKLKQWQEFALVDFDVSALAGRGIRSAAVVVTPVGETRLGLNGGSDLGWLTVSTVSHDWVEGHSRRYAVDRVGRGASVIEAVRGSGGWGWPESRVWDVSLGNGNTLRFDGRLEPTTSRLSGKPALRLELDPRLVVALATATSHGLLLMDGSTDVATNSFIASRESGDGAYLEVEIGSPGASPPDRPLDLKAGPSPGSASRTGGAIELDLVVPERAFGYRLTLDGRAVERWQIPFAGASGDHQSIRLVDLEPSRRHRLEVEVVGEDGSVSESIVRTVASSAALPTPEISPLPRRAAGAPARLGDALVYALPEVTRVDPIDGSLIGEPAADSMRESNAVWSGAHRRIHLDAARGEIVGFQVAVEGRASDLWLEPSELSGGTVIPSAHYRLWRTWYVGRNPEYAVPLRPPLEVPSLDNPVAGQTIQTVGIDLHVPIGTPPGLYRGELVVSTSAGESSLEVVLEVHAATLPLTPTFNLELNTYQGPGRAGGDRFIDNARLAHYHRATINRVPYTHRGRVHEDWAPRVDRAGRITDWSGFDDSLGGMLDGSWFADNPRSGVPARVLYLPLFEGWPLDFRQHYAPGPGLPMNALDPLAKLRHDTLALPLDEALTPEFRNAFIRAVRGFLRHIEARGWDRTLFQVYLNNKPRYGYTLWTLDEPFELLDWLAVDTFAELTRQALQQPELHRPGFQGSLLERDGDGLARRRPTIMFRADVSRPMWMGSVADGLVNALYVGSDSLPLRRLLHSHRERMPALLSAYATPPSVEGSAWRSAAWCLEAYAAGADGVLPWQSIAGPEALDEPVDTGLLIDAGSHGRAVASFRLHAMRRGAQDVELLRLLARHEGWSRLEVAHYIANALGSDGPLAISPSWRHLDGLTTASFYRLKRDVLLRLGSRGGGS